jgi:hypothetical protein
MKNHVLLESCLKELKLPTILREYRRAARQCAQEDRGYEAFLEHLVELEVAERRRKATQRRFKEAGFPMEKEIADFQFTAIPKLSKKRILDLAKAAYIEKRECAVFLGPPGMVTYYYTSQRSGKSGSCASSAGVRGQRRPSRTAWTATWTSGRSRCLRSMTHGAERTA